MYLRINEIIKIVSNDLGVTIEDIIYGSRTSHLAIARHLTMFLSHKYTGLSYLEIGKYLHKSKDTVRFATYKAKTDFIMQSYLKELIEKCEGAIKKRLKNNYLEKKLKKLRYKSYIKLRPGYKGVHNGT